ncbi:MAG: bifunctional DNA-formamidopyrimidine glycosylase/DNA-(apurinic or apyrimidinic site) lyase [Burkholderiales bacterium]|nr:bifunctional DNA-formamidopyrimidine glycosylase/DNA-(apurinic or apyrimidinic site) lyase [Burkholderiales bacterium]
MPELPEVEVVRRGLQASVLERTVDRIEVRQPRLRWPVPADLPQRLAARRVLAVGRRGKYLLLDFGDGTLIVHLGMSGSFRFLRQPQPPAAHDHVDLHFQHGLLRYNDPRRFGAMLWHDAADGPVEQTHPLLTSLGVEPLAPGFDGELLHRATRGRRVAIKQALLAGTIVVGVGNIYASESLFRAGIRPTTPASRISRERYDRLAQAIRDTLSDAIGRGGSTLRNFVASDGASGYFQLDCFVYGRDGQPCRRCGTPVRVLRQQQRSTFFCPSCQR